MANQSKVQWVYSSRDNQEMKEHYDEWAKGYTNDLAVVFLYLASERAAWVFASHVPRHALVLDAGAGTGLVGEAFLGLDYNQLYLAWNSPGACW